LPLPPLLQQLRHYVGLTPMHKSAAKKLRPSKEPPDPQAVEEVIKRVADLLMLPESPFYPQGPEDNSYQSDHYLEKEARVNEQCLAGWAYDAVKRLDDAAMTQPLREYLRTLLRQVQAGMRPLHPGHAGRRSTFPIDDYVAFLVDWACDALKITPTRNISKPKRNEVMEPVSGCMVVSRAFKRVGIPFNEDKVRDMRLRAKRGPIDFAGHLLKASQQLARIHRSQSG